MAAVILIINFVCFVQSESPKLIDDIAHMEVLPPSKPVLSYADYMVTRNITILFPLPISIFLGTLSTIVSLSTVAGNLLVIIAFFVERQLRNPTNYFIFSLAVTDLLIGIFSMNFYTLYLLMNHWPLGELFCDLWLSLDYTACLTSQYTVFFITVDRFCSVHIPAKYRNWRTDNKVLFMVAATWIIPSVIFFTCILGWPFFTGKRGCPPDRCYAGFTESKWFTTALTIGYFWITLAVMSGLYGAIYHVALNLQKKSDAKRRKMISLMSMAGQTMSRIGVGVENNDENDNDLDSGDNKDARIVTETKVMINNNKTNKKFHSKQAKQKDHKGEDRNSSPTFPSDSDIVSVEDLHKPPTLNLTNTKNQQTAKVIHQIESPVIKDESPTLVETSPFSFYPFVNFNGVTGTTTSARFTKQRAGKRRDLTVHVYSAQSNDSDYVTASGVSNDLQQSQNSLLGYQYIDMNSWNNSSTRVGLTMPVAKKSVSNNHNSSRHNNTVIIRSSHRNHDNISEYSSNNSSCSTPVWVRRSKFSYENNNNSDDNNNNQSNDNHERDPVTMDTFVITKTTTTNQGDYQVGLVKSFNSIPPPPSYNSLFPRISCASNVDFIERVTQFTSAINFQSILTGLRARFTSLFYQVHRAVSNIGKPTIREPKEKIGRGKTENRARKALKTITFILGAFVICWTPYHILVLVQVHHADIVNDHLFNLSYWLCYSNSPINPFCYALANIQFKKTFLRILRGDFHRT